MRICVPFADEARKRFKTYVTLLSTIKNENGQKFLILRKKYVNECPTEDAVERAVAAAANSAEPSSPGGASLNLEASFSASPLRQPPPYKPPPMVTSPMAAAPVTGLTVSEEHQENYKDCVQEFAAAIQRIDPKRLEKEPEAEEPPRPPPTSASRSNSVDETANKENIPRFSFSSGASTDSSSAAEKPETSTPETDAAESAIISVKEATRKFNRMASEEEAKIISPPAKKKPEKVSAVPPKPVGTGHQGSSDMRVQFWCLFSSSKMYDLVFVFSFKISSHVHQSLIIKSVSFLSVLFRLLLTISLIKYMENMQKSITTSPSPNANFSFPFFATICCISCSSVGRFRQRQSKNAIFFAQLSCD